MKPILFNTAMVNAILDGRKTTTRRIIKRTPSNDTPSGYGFWKEFNEDDNELYIKDYTHSCCWWTEKEYINRFSKFHIGDILYIRETWFEGDILDSNGDIVKRNIVLYRTDDLSEHDIEEIKWKPSIHMPKRLARIFLKVTGVRVERLHDITVKGIDKEGTITTDKFLEIEEKMNEYYIRIAQNQDIKRPNYYYDEFKKLWDSTVNKKDMDKYSWNANPYVWAIEFERCEKQND
mgnify:CR=1 FL=1